MENNFLNNLYLWQETNNKISRAEEQKEKRRDLARMNYWQKKGEKTKPPALDEDCVKALAEALQGIKLVSLTTLLGNMERY